MNKYLYLYTENKKKRGMARFTFNGLAQRKNRPRSGIVRLKIKIKIKQAYNSIILSFT